MRSIPMLSHIYFPSSSYNHGRKSSLQDTPHTHVGQDVGGLQEEEGTVRQELEPVPDGIIRQKENWG